VEADRLGRDGRQPGVPPDARRTGCHHGHDPERRPTAEGRVAVVDVSRTIRCASFWDALVLGSLLEDQGVQVRRPDEVSLSIVACGTLEKIKAAVGQLSHEFPHAGPVIIEGEDRGGARGLSTATEPPRRAPAPEPPQQASVAEPARGPKPSRGPLPSRLAQPPEPSRGAATLKPPHPPQTPKPPRRAAAREPSSAPQPSSAPDRSSRTQAEPSRQALAPEPSREASPRTAEVSDSGRA
jgi:hypothetical protein